MTEWNFNDGQVSEGEQRNMSHLGEMSRPVPPPSVGSDEERAAEDRAMFSGLVHVSFRAKKV